MPRYSIALLPRDTKDQDIFKILSQRYFSHLEEGYILSENALAHVTLCQFYADNEVIASSAFRSLECIPDEELSFEDFHLRPGAGEHSGFLWAEFLIEGSNSLREKQKNTFLHLAQQGLITLTPFATYSPHLTLARIRDRVTPFPKIAELGQKPIMHFRLSLGLSTEKGVFVREIKI